MLICTKAVWDCQGNLLSENTRFYFGPTELAKGPSAEQRAAEQRQAAFSQQLMDQYKTAFGNQNAVFSAIRAVYDPILAAGPNQYGFSNAEDTTLRTQASEGTVANYTQASKAAAERIAARGGGNSFLPSGTEAQITADIAGAAARDESGKQLDITKTGYEQGYQAFQDATKVEEGVAAGYNPLGYAGAATGSNTADFNMAAKIQEMKNASSPWGAIGGLVGGLAGSFAGPFGASIGNKLGGFLGNAGSGNYNPTNAFSPGFSQNPSDSYT
jgi:hypothetical protein